MTSRVAVTDEHIGYGKHDVSARAGKSGNRDRSKTVMTEIGPGEIPIVADSERLSRPGNRGALR
jgi:hypothetical protein